MLNKEIEAQRQKIDTLRSALQNASLEFALGFFGSVPGFIDLIAHIVCTVGDIVHLAADMAITDMSDNANKMGTDMASIQNAYQGFAKQNYTMLDNLKLGYGRIRLQGSVEPPAWN